MAINFPTPSSVGDLFTDPSSGNVYVCTVVGPPAQWVGSGSTTDIDGTYLRLDTTNDPLTGGLAISSTLDVTGNTTIGGSNIQLFADGSSTFTGIINNNRMPREWGEVNANGTKRTGSFASSSTTATGVYSVVLSSPLPQSTYTVVTGVTDASMRLITCDQATQTTTGFEVRIAEVSGGGVSLAPANFSFVLFYG